MKFSTSLMDKLIQNMCIFIKCNLQTYNSIVLFILDMFTNSIKETNYIKINWYFISHQYKLKSPVNKQFDAREMNESFLKIDFSN